MEAVERTLRQASSGISRRGPSWEPIFRLKSAKDVSVAGGMETGAEKARWEDLMGHPADEGREQRHKGEA